MPPPPQLAFSPLVLHLCVLVALPLPLKAAPLVAGGFVSYTVHTTKNLGLGDVFFSDVFKSGAISGIL